MAGEATSTEAFDGTQSTGTASNNDNLLVALGGALDAETTSVRLDDLLLSFDVYTALFLVNLKLGKGVESRCIFDVTSGDLEAS